MFLFKDTSTTLTYILIHAHLSFSPSLVSRCIFIINIIVIAKILIHLTNVTFIVSSVLGNFNSEK